MLLVLLGLGTWQLHRLAWKEAILAQVAAAQAAAPVPLPADPGPFEKVSVTGRFLPGPTALYGVEVRDLPTGSTMGGQLLMPFAADGRVILVDRGWVPSTAAITAPTVPAPPGPVTLVGFARPAEHPHLLSVSDDTVGRLFFTLDPQRIAAVLGLGRVAPFTFVVLGPAPAGGGPIPADQLPHPPNNHFYYAVTWFGLAGALVVMFIAWARGRLFDEPV